MSEQIKQQISDLLEDSGIVFEVTGGNQTTCNDWKCFAWGCSFSTTSKAEYINGYPKKIKTESFEYFTGIGLAKKDQFGKVTPNKPHVADVLYSLIRDGSACGESFDHWCADYGYDTDSRKALETYLLCQSNYNKLFSVLGGLLCFKVKELLQDY